MNSALLRRARADNDAFPDQVHAAPSHADFDFAWLKAGLWRSRWILLGGAIIGAVIGLAFALLATPIFSASTTMQIEAQAPQVLGGGADSVESTANNGTEEYLKTQVAILTSRTLIERVARALDYPKNNTFFDQMAMEHPDAAPGSEGHMRAVVNQIAAHLIVSPVEETRLVSITYQSPDPAQTRAIANEVAKQFIQSTLEHRFATTDYSRRFLQQQIEETRMQLENSERHLIRYAQAAGITSVGNAAGSTDGAGRTSLTDANLTALNAAYAQARTARILAEQKWTAASKAPLLAVPQVISNSSIQSMQSARASKIAELQGELQRHTGDYPTVVKLKAEIAAADAMINASAKSIVNAIRSEYEITQQQEESLARNVDELRGTSLNEQGRGVQLSILRREADTNRALYDALLQRYREINATAGITINNISVVDQAELPRAPVWPKPVFNLLIGLIAGFLFGAVVAIVRERLNDTVRLPSDVERVFNLPLMGILPLSKTGSVHEDLEDPASSLSEAVYSMRSTLTMATSHGLPRSLAFTSTQQGEGKSTTSLALARELAQAGQRTLIVDCDLRRPSLHRLFDVANTSGFSSFLTGQEGLDTLIRKLPVEGLDLLTSGPLPISAPRLLMPEVLQPAMAQLCDRYDIVIMDCPPVLGLADAVELTAVAEATAYIHEAGGVSHRQMRESLHRLDRAGANVIGIVLTKFDFENSGYTYGYSQYYYNYEGDKKSQA